MAVRRLGLVSGLTRQHVSTDNVEESDKDFDTNGTRSRRTASSTQALAEPYWNEPIERLLERALFLFFISWCLSELKQGRAEWKNVIDTHSAYFTYMEYMEAGWEPVL